MSKRLIERCQPDSIREFRASAQQGSVMDAIPVSPEVAERLNALLETALRDQDPRRSQSAVRELLALPEPLLSHLVEFLGTTLKHSDFAAQRRAAQILGLLGPSAVLQLPPLIETLRSQRWTLREAAVLALGQVGSNSSDARAALVQIALHDRVGLVREAAARAMNCLGRELSAAVTDLQTALRHHYPRVRCRALRALARVAPQNPQSVSKALTDSHCKVRCTAAEVLGLLGTSAHSAIPALLRRLADGDVKVQTAARGALEKLKESLPATSQHWLTRFTRQDSSFADKLREALEHPELSTAIREAFLEMCQQRLRWYDKIFGANKQPQDYDSAYELACQVAATAEQSEAGASRGEWARLLAWLWTPLQGFPQSS